MNVPLDYLDVEKLKTVPIEKNSWEKKVPDATKLPNTNGLVTTTVFHTKINEVENKRPNIQNLVTTTVWTQKLMKLRIKLLIIINILQLPIYGIWYILIC